MRITSNATLNKVILFFVLWFCVYKNSVADNDIVIKKYAYGSLFWGQEKHSEPEIYSLFDSNEYIPEGTNIIDIGTRYTINQRMK